MPRAGPGSPHPRLTGTPLVSRQLQRRNTLSDVTYATMNRLDLTFTAGEA